MRISFVLPLLLLPAIAHASLVLPAAIYQGHGSLPNANIVMTGPGTVSKSYSDPINRFDSGDLTITIAGGPDPLVIGGADSSVSEADASGELFYYMEIVGGAGPVPVNIDVAASLFASSYGDGSGGAGLVIEQASCITGIDCLDSWGVCSIAESAAACEGQPSSLALKTTVPLLSNTLYFVEIAAGGDAPNPVVPYDVVGGGRGTADPSFHVDSSNPGYSIVLSAGIGNPGPTSVPEPATFAVMAAAIAAAAGSRRRWMFGARAKSPRPFAAPG